MDKTGTETGFKMEGAELLERAEKRIEALLEEVGMKIYELHEHEMTIKVLWSKVFELKRTVDNLRACIDDLREARE